MDIVELIATIGLNVDEEQWNRANEVIEKTRKNIEALGEAHKKHKGEGGEEGEGGLAKELQEGLEAFAGIEGVKSIKEMIEHTMEATIAAKHLGERLGITTEAVQALGYAADVSGSSQAALTSGLQRLSFNLQGGGLHAKGFSSALSKLGISSDELRKTVKHGGEGGGLDAALEEIAEKFKHMPNGAEKAALAMQLFGRGAGPQLIPFLNQGKEGIVSLREEAEKLGVTMGEEDVEKLEQHERAMKRLNARWGAVKDAIVVAIIPALTMFVNALGDVVAFLKQHESLMITLFGAIAAAITYTLIPAFEKLKTRWHEGFGGFMGKATAIIAIIQVLWEIFAHGGKAIKVVTTVLLVALGLWMIIMKLTGKAAKGMWTDILGPIGPLIPILGIVIALFTELRDKFERIFDEIADLPVIKQLIQLTRAIEKILGLRVETGGFKTLAEAQKSADADATITARAATKAKFDPDALDPDQFSGSLAYWKAARERRAAQANAEPTDLSSLKDELRQQITIHNDVKIDARGMSKEELTGAMDEHHKNQLRDAHEALRKGD